MKPSIFSMVQPSLFHGTAIATGLGLALGLAAHGPWPDQQHAGGPQLLVSAAANPARLAADPDGAPAPAGQAVAYADTPLTPGEQLPSTPLPVTRLTGRGGSAIPAAAYEVRVSADSAAEDAAAVTVVGDFRDDAPAPPRASTPYAPVVYTQTGDGR